MYTGHSFRAFKFINVYESLLLFNEKKYFFTVYMLIGNPYSGYIHVMCLSGIQEKQFQTRFEFPWVFIISVLNGKFCDLFWRLFWTRSLLAKQFGYLHVWR